MAPMPIETLHIEGYGCVKDATVRLSPLHALIGPNDSGKSTILRALRMAAQFKVYALGELWISYANGDDEAPLFAEVEEQPDRGEDVEWTDAQDRLP